MHGQLDALNAKPQDRLSKLKIYIHVSDIKILVFITFSNALSYSIADLIFSMHELIVCRCSRFLRFGVWFLRSVCLISIVMIRLHVSSRRLVLIGFLISVGSVFERKKIFCIFRFLDWVCLVA